MLLVCSVYLPEQNPTPSSSAMRRNRGNANRRASSCFFRGALCMLSTPSPNISDQCASLRKYSLYQHHRRRFHRFTSQRATLFQQFHSMAAADKPDCTLVRTLYWPSVPEVSQRVDDTDPLVTTLRGKNNSRSARNSIARAAGCRLHVARHLAS